MSVERWQVANWAAGRGWLVGRLFEESREEKSNPRPLLRDALARVCFRESDGIVVVTLAHLGDSLEEALGWVEQIAAAGGTFASVRDGIDLSTPTGRQIFVLLISITEWWRAA